MKPYQPPGIWEEATFGNEASTSRTTARRCTAAASTRSGGGSSARRMFFDAAGAAVLHRSSRPARTRRCTPDDAERRDLRRGGPRAGRAGDEADAANAGGRIELAFRLVLARKPAEQERQVLVAGVERLRKQFAEDPSAAKKLLAAGEAKRDEKIDPANTRRGLESAALILNLDEALTKE